MCAPARPVGTDGSIADYPRVSSLYVNRANEEGGNAYDQPFRQRHVFILQQIYITLLSLVAFFFLFFSKERLFFGEYLREFPV